MGCWQTFISYLLLSSFLPRNLMSMSRQRVVTALTWLSWALVVSPQKRRGLELLLVKSTNSSAVSLAPQEVPSSSQSAQYCHKPLPVRQLIAWLCQLLLTCMISAFQQAHVTSTRVTLIPRVPKAAIFIIPRHCSPLVFALNAIIINCSKLSPSQPRTHLYFSTAY